MRSLERILQSGVCLVLSMTAPAAAFADADRCASLATAKLADVAIESATLQPAHDPVDGAVIPDPTGAQSSSVVSGLPAFCRVIGRASPEAGSDIRFEVWLPSDDWTGRFTGANNGGLAGSILYSDLAAAVTAGHAGAATDTGHVGPTGLESDWAIGHPERVRDYGWRAIHVTAVVAKQLIAAYYGRGPDYSYFIGCSNGGRQGLMEAWRYPDDYDGIIAGAPAARFTTLTASFIGAIQAQLPQGAALRADQMSRLESETLKQCDALDGQSDGLVAAPWACELDTAPLSCDTTDAPECFSAAQLTALTQIITGRQDRYGRTLAEGRRPAGAEAGPFGWGGWLTAEREGPTPFAILSRALLQDLMQRPTATPDTFDFGRDLRALDRALGPDLDVEPRLRRFFERGGKLILWHGWADASIPAQLTLDFQRAVSHHAGSLARDALRTFLVPGVQHCGGGNGPDVLGQTGAPPLGAAPERSLGAALQTWVETGRAPNSVTGGFSNTGVPGRERLVCALPKHAALQAGADPNRGESYVCED